MRDRDRCKFPGCPTRASFGARGSRPMFCRSHALEDHINLRARVLCKHPDCGKNALFRKVSTLYKCPPEYCTNHAPDGYINRVRTLCVVRGCEFVATYRHRIGQMAKYCELHAPSGYRKMPEKPRRKRATTKVAETPKAEEPTPTVTTSKPIPAAPEIAETFTQYFREIESGSEVLDCFCAVDPAF